MGRMLWEKYPEKDAALEAAVVDPKRTWTEIGVLVGASADACRQRARRARFLGWDYPRSDGIVRTHVPAVVSKPGPAPVPVEQLWGKVEEQTAEDVVRHEHERMIDVAIDDDRPIGLVFASDQHIRQSGPIMVRRMREDAELVAATDGLYGILGGDGVDNHIKHREAMANGGDKPKDSWRLYDHYIGLWDRKLLAMVSGNHDDWTRDFTGVDQVKTLAGRNAVHYAPDEALIRLALGTQPYRILMRHQFQYNSKFNLGHTVKRLWEMGNDDFDVGVVGHHHQAACEPFQKHGVWRWALRPGSYQLSSSHSRRYGYAHSYPTCPTVILYPNRREIMGILDVWQAASYLTWLREEWPRSDVQRPAA